MPFCIVCTYIVFNMTKQLYDARAKVVKPCEQKYWHQLSFTCMSEEESATEDENNDKYIIRHSPNWRSPGKKCLSKHNGGYVFY